MHDVAFFASAFHPHRGGVEETVKRLAAEQSARGGRPLVVTARWPKTLVPVDEVENLPVRRYVFRVPERRPRQFLGAALFGPGTMRDISQAVAAHGARFVHVQCVSANAWYARRVARRLDLPLIVTLQGELTMDASGVYQRSRVLPRLLRQLLTEADAVTACSAATLEEAVAFSGVDLGDRGHVVHNGVRIDEIAGAEPHRHRRPYVLAIGRLVPQKGFDVLIRAFGRTAVARAGTHDLLLAGDGPMHERLQEEVDRAGLTEHVQLVGGVDRPAAASLFAGASLFVLPSLHEPMGIVNLEAMAAGLPIIATAVGGVPELVVHGESGLLVPPGDPMALAGAIDGVLGDVGRARSLGAAARARAVHFDWERIADRYGDVYDRVGHTRR